MTARAFGKQLPLVAAWVAAVAAAPAGAQAVIATSEGSPWQFAATLYAFLPSFDSTSSFPTSGTGDEFPINAGSILDHLKMTFMGTFDAHEERWGFFLDTLYVDLGAGKSNYREGSIGDTLIPVTTSADVNLDLKTWLVTAAGEYRFAHAPDRDFYYLFGARYLDIKMKFGWSFNGSIGNLPPAANSGTSENKDSNLDGIVGIKGQFRVGRDYKWMIPLYFDVGTGASRVTWQLAGGVGYRFDWGDITGMYRIIYYDLGGHEIQDLTVRGPMIGATFRW